MSNSGGQISLCQFDEGTSKLCQTLQWIGHQYEAWITAFDAWNSDIVYSGTFSETVFVVSDSNFKLFIFTISVYGLSQV